MGLPPGSHHVGRLQCCTETARSNRVTRAPSSTSLVRSQGPNLRRRAAPRAAQRLRDEAPLTLDELGARTADERRPEREPEHDTSSEGARGLRGVGGRSVHRVWRSSGDAHRQGCRGFAVGEDGAVRRSAARGACLNECWRSARAFDRSAIEPPHARRDPSVARASCRAAPGKSSPACSVA